MIKMKDYKKNTKIKLHEKTFSNADFNPKPILD